MSTKDHMPKAWLSGVVLLRPPLEGEVSHWKHVFEGIIGTPASATLSLLPGHHEARIFAPP
jgi:hypothetical protein